MGTIAWYYGIRIDLFWLLAKPNNLSVDRKSVKGKVASRAGYRVSLRGGFALDFVGFDGKMKVNTVLKYPSFIVTPQNMTAGEPSNLVVKVGHATVNGTPTWLFQNNSEEQTSLKFTLPNWLSDSVQS